MFCAFGGNTNFAWCVCGWVCLRQQCPSFFRTGFPHTTSLAGSLTVHKVDKKVARPLDRRARSARGVYQGQSRRVRARMQRCDLGSADNRTRRNDTTTMWSPGDLAAPSLTAMQPLVDHHSYSSENRGQPRSWYRTSPLPERRTEPHRCLGRRRLAASSAYSVGRGVYGALRGVRGVQNTELFHITS